MPFKSREKKRKAQRESYRRSVEAQPWKGMFLSCRKRARQQGVKFDLTREWFEAKWTGRCELTDIPFVAGSGGYHPLAPSVDRVKHGEGYTQDNCRIVLLCINMFRGRLTDKQVMKISRRLCDTEKRTNARNV